MLILLTHLIYNMTIQINNIMRMIIMLSNVLWADFLLLYAIVSDDYINILWYYGVRLSSVITPHNPFVFNVVKIFELCQCCKLMLSLILYVASKYKYCDQSKSIRTLVSMPSCS